MQFVQPSGEFLDFGWPKIGTQTELEILKKLFKHKPLSDQLVVNRGKSVLVHRIAHYFIKCFNFTPYFCSDRDGVKKSDDYKEYCFDDSAIPSVIAAINSTTFYFYWQVFYDAFKAGKHCVEHFPFNSIGDDTTQKMLKKLSDKLMKDLKSHSNRLEATYRTSGKVEYDQFFPRKSKPIMDEIDSALAKHYGLSEPELDFLINYDVKFRVSNV